MTFTVIDVSKLPPPKAVEELAIDTIFKEQMADLRALDEKLADGIRVGDPAYNVLLVSSVREGVLRQRINEAVLAVMLPYAEKADLDNLASYWNVKRLMIDPGDPDAVPPVAPIYESDDELRFRVQLAMEGQTNAGTEGSYLYQAESSDGRVKSAAVKSPTEGDVILTILSTEGDGAPSADLLTIVRAHMMQKFVRQLTDNLTVQGAGIIPYAVNATLYIQPGPGADQVMEAARRALTEYVEAMHAIGRMVPISGIYAALQQPGVIRVDLTSPTADIVPTHEQAAYCVAINLTQGAA